jgi:hypothetical protein
MWLRRQRGRLDREGGPSPARADALVAVYSRKGTLFFWAFNETDVLWQGSEAVWTLPEDRDASDVGDALFQAADSSGRAPYHIRGELDGMRPVLDAARVRSHKAFAEGARLVEAERRGAEWLLTPTRRKGKSFLHEPDQALVLIAPGAAELGDALKLAMNRSA